ncbi:MAG TPA: class I SAM-dependent methyltransferase [Burkholderiales bacterium]|nr:class I SAM-dependent methyltransferase [Burkholderiales bacterium]
MLAPLKRLLLRMSGNSIAANLRMWSDWDWSRRGEEWTSSPQWKASLVRHVLEPNVPAGSRVLEIGPGAGRWTEVLQRRASHLTLVDLAPRCIELCRERFGDAGNIEYHVNDGRDLGFVPDASVDRIWSFDVFVHIQASDVERYVRQFPRLLAPGGVGVVHHSKDGKTRRGWRSDMTAGTMRRLCEENGLEVVQQFDSWDEGRVRLWGSEGGPDIVTIFRRRSA